MLSAHRSTHTAKHSRAAAGLAHGWRGTRPNPSTPFVRLAAGMRPCRYIVRALFLLGGLVWTSSAVAAADETPLKVALLDTIAFTPPLERVNAREKLEEGLATTVRAHGWEPVTIVSDCHDVSCAGTVAAQAGVSYVLILVGRFVAADTYATDVGVALWREGTVVGARTETQEDAERGPRAGGGPRCGPPDGTCTPQVLQSKLEEYAAKVLAREKTALTARRLTATTAPPTPTAIMPSPVVSQTGDTGKVGRIVGWSLVGAGVVLGGGAVGLWAVSGTKSHCSPASLADGDGCRYEWNTTTPAIVLGVVGAAAAAAGVVLLISDRPSSQLALNLHGSGVGLEGTF